MMKKIKLNTYLMYLPTELSNQICKHDTSKKDTLVLLKHKSQIHIFT